MDPGVSVWVPSPLYLRYDHLKVHIGVSSFLGRIISSPHSLLTAFPSWESHLSIAPVDLLGAHTLLHQRLHWNPCLGYL